VSTGANNQAEKDRNLLHLLADVLDECEPGDDQPLTWGAARRQVRRAAEEAESGGAEHRPNRCCDYHRHVADGCCHCERPLPPASTDGGDSDE